MYSNKEISLNPERERLNNDLRQKLFEEPFE